MFRAKNAEFFKRVDDMHGHDGAFKVLQELAARICKSIVAKPVSAGAFSGTLDFTVSVGLSALAGSNDKVEEFLRRADQTIYRTKCEGHNEVTHVAA